VSIKNRSRDTTPPLSSPSPLNSSMQHQASFDSTNEMSSIYSIPLMDTIQNESVRRKVRAEEMRSTRSRGNTAKKINASKNKRISNSTRSAIAARKQEQQRLRSSSSGTNSTGTRSIMIVRTLEESLATTSKEHTHWKNVVDNKRKRSVLRRRLDGAIKDLSPTGGRYGSRNGTPNLQLNKTTGSNNTSVSDQMSDSASLSSMTSLSNVSTQNFEVKFEDVTVREYFMIPGDNPSVSRGPPVTIEWFHNCEEIHDIEYYEKYRQDVRRRQDQMKMPPHVREDLLLNNGYTFLDLREYTKQATIIRRQRYRTIEMLHTDNVEEKIESLKRLVKRPFRSKEEKEDERKIKAYYLPDKGGNDQDTDLDTTKRVDNRSDWTNPLDVSRHGKKYDLNPITESVNSQSTNILDISRNGKKYDLLINSNDQEHPSNQLDTSRHGTKYNLLPTNQDTVPDLLNSSLDSFDSLDASRRMKVDLTSGLKETDKVKDMNGFYEVDDTSVGEEDTSVLFCLPSGIFKRGNINFS